ncbi:MAG: hypothetical protein NZ959_06430 [Armatimonadetes bacterium]|nr:hypothetical protein [Armatimonadota bacterium]MDW8122021.1 hypothetical protein [Armatimonadota bacterium]
MRLKGQVALSVFLVLPSLLGITAWDQPDQKAFPLSPLEQSVLGDVRQLTFEGVNAEAYWSPDARFLIFQSTRGPFKADQIFIMRSDGRDLRLVSTGKGRTTCGYFLQNGRSVLFSSTHLAGPEPPQWQKPSLGRYVWPIFPSYDLYVRRLDTMELIRLTTTDGYDAEATVCWQTGEIVFTSHRDGDLDIYRMKSNGSEVVRLTSDLGYEGGAFFSPDGKRIVMRAYYPKTQEEIQEYLDLLKSHVVSPRWLEIYIMDRDGKNKRAVTQLGRINFCPAWTPDGRKIIFASNHHDPKNFDLFLIGTDGKGLKRLTDDPAPDLFPHFSPDGRWLVWCSGRSFGGAQPLQVFRSRWIGMD